MRPACTSRTGDLAAAGRRLAVVSLLALGFHAYAQQTGPSVFPEICDVAVMLDSKSADPVVIWSGGTPPFLIVRADAPRFDSAAELLYLADGVSQRRHLDTKARKPDRRYYYQVYDYHSAREIFSGPEHSHGTGKEIEHDDEPAPNNNYCKGVLRRPATWK